MPARDIFFATLPSHLTSPSTQVSSKKQHVWGRDFGRLNEQEKKRKKRLAVRWYGPKVVAFASRSFISPSTVFSGLRPTQ
jgi:hypothetical protein